LTELLKSHGLKGNAETSDEDHKSQKSVDQSQPV